MITHAFYQILSHQPTLSPTLIPSFSPTLAPTFSVSDNTTMSFFISNRGKSYGLSPFIKLAHRCPYFKPDKTPNEETISQPHQVSNIPSIKPGRLHFHQINRSIFVAPNISDDNIGTFKAILFSQHRALLVSRP